jgi:protein involved in polysaccharide export with SLBB domain
LIAGLALSLWLAPLAAQTPDTLYASLASAQRTQVSRAELEASLRSIDAVLASDGYSSAVKEQKRAEAELIRSRLTEGDLYPGDVVLMAVAGVPELTGPLTVTERRTIIPPGARTEISVANLLRSEIEPYLREQMKRFVRDPLVVASAQIRIQVFGGVGREGFFIVSASAPLTDVIMGAAGGPRNQNFEKSKIYRGDRVIMEGDAFVQAIRESKSLDQLNLQAGDEIRVGEKQGSTILRALGVVSSLASATWLMFRIF